MMEKQKPSRNVEAVPKETKVPGTMSKIFSWVGGAIALFALYLGRATISATYERGVQHLTVTYMRIVGSGVLLTFLSLALVLWFSYMEWHAPISLISIAFPFLFLFFCALPAFSLPMSAAIAGYDAAEEGDQSNYRLIFKGARGYLRALCVVVVWVEIFLVGLNFVPTGKSFAVTSFILSAIIIMLAALGTSRVTISSLLYERIFKIAAWSAALGVLILFALAVPVEIRAKYGMDFGGGVTKTDAARYVNDQKSKSLLDERGARKEQYISALMECRANTQNFTDAAKSTYEKGCGKDVEPKGLTLDEVRAGWPQLFTHEAGTKDASGKVLLEGPPFWSDPIAWVKHYWELLLAMGTGMIVLHLLFLVGGPILGFLGIKKLLKKDEVEVVAAATTTTKKTETKSVNTSSGGSAATGAFVASIIFGAVLVGLYMAGKSELEKEGAWPTKAIAAQKAENGCEVWRGTFSDLSNNAHHHKTPFDRFHGMQNQVKLLPGCRFEEKLSMTLSFDGSQTLPLSGNCKAGQPGKFWSCTGVWDREAGATYVLAWDAHNTFIVKMYAGIDTEAQAIKWIRFVKNS